MAGIAATLVAVAGGDVDGHLGPTTASAGGAAGGGDGGGLGIGMVGRHCWPVWLAVRLSARHKAKTRYGLELNLSGLQKGVTRPTDART